MTIAKRVGKTTYIGMPRQVGKSYDGTCGRCAGRLDGYALCPKLQDCNDVYWIKQEQQDEQNKTR